MNDQSLTLLAALIEIGLPLSVLWLYRHYPRFRPKLIVVLGAVTPFIVGYGFVSIQTLFTHYFSTQSAADRQWAFYAMWSMSFTPYMACAIGAALLSLLKRPNHLAARYCFGLTIPLLLVLLFLY